MAGFPGAMPAPHNPFPNRNRRQLSIGGPPKAILGGPQRKLSPNPIPSVPSAGVSGSTTPSGAPANPQPAAAVKVKKVMVNLPKETIPSEEEGVAATKAVFARIPLKPEEIVEDTDVWYPELTTCEEFPSEQFRHHIPSTVDVFLPGKVRVIIRSNVNYTYAFIRNSLHGRVSNKLLLNKSWKSLASNAAETLVQTLSYNPMLTEELLLCVFS